ncbi:MAG: ATP-binding cassette domain-containing protein [Verrucomicrobiales bacterium]|nr:ATP-binding cassette domain-containing protein [Verrucomicrobiales bacterium]
MIETKNLTKRFAGRTAVDALSFSLERGEIVGFLGPNGAGKSTTMRMLTGYLPATSGSVKVAGFDIFNDSLKARREIGYMPESVPLYDDMRVKEYLVFRAKLKGLKRAGVTENVNRVMDLCGLGEVRNKLVSVLSKGFRQRLGLADALVHKPALLILDEPTNGLDPNQTRQVRNLIGQLGSEHTILLSTHLLSEVEMICRRVVILDKGRIKADDTPDNLIQQIRASGALRVEAKADGETVQNKLQQLAGVRRVVREALPDGWTQFLVKTDPGADVREEIFRLAAANQWLLRELSLRGLTLEDVFVELTQREG